MDIWELFSGQTGCMIISYNSTIVGNTFIVNSALES